MISERGFKPTIFYHHDSTPSSAGDDWYFNGEAHTVDGPGTGGADFQVWLHLHSDKPTMTSEEAERLRAGTQGGRFKEVGEVKPCDPIIDKEEPGKYGFLARVVCDRPFRRY